jgi:hypothetical protein
MNSRFVIALLASAAAVCAATAASAAATAAATEPAKNAGAHHHAQSHRHATRHAPQARSTAALSIGRNAAAQSRLAADVARGRVSPTEAVAIESEAAKVDRTVANLLVDRADPTGNARIAEAERGFTRTVAETERTYRSQEALERQHVRVATARDAEQQRLIAQGLRSGRLNAVQASELERAQAAIVATQADLERGGRETVNDALRVQHLQDVQDWAIRTGHEPGSARA